MKTIYLKTNTNDKNMQKKQTENIKKNIQNNNKNHNSISVIKITMLEIL